MIPFTDKHGREILIDADGSDDVSATHNGVEIARFSILRGDHIDERMPDNEPSSLFHLHMEDDYFRSGIGFAMLKEAVVQHDKLAPPSNRLDDKNRMTDRGLAFVRAGIKAGLIFPLPEEPY
ncbi:hypothetical protein D3C71_301990 [compost metagenome]